MDARGPYRRVSEADRVRIVSHRERGDTFRAISDEFGVNINTVYKIIAKWNRHRTIQDLYKIGRPPKLDDRTRRHLVRMVENNEIKTATQLAHAATTQLHTPISPRTARRMLHEEGLNALHTIPKPLLTPEHKRQRLEFAQTHAHWTEDNWKQVIFSDESIITA